MKLYFSSPVAIIATLAAQSHATQLRGGRNQRDLSPLKVASCVSQTADVAITALEEYQNSGKECSENIGDLNDLVEDAKKYYTARKNVGKLSKNIQKSIKNLSSFIDTIRPMLKTLGAIVSG